MQQTHILTNTSFHRKGQALKEGLTTGEEKEGGHLKCQESVGKDTDKNEHGLKPRGQRTGSKEETEDGFAVETGRDWGRVRDHRFAPSEGAKHHWTWSKVRKERKKQMKRLGEFRSMKKYKCELWPGSAD